MHDSGDIGDGYDSGDGNTSKDDVDAALEAAVKGARAE